MSEPQEIQPKPEAGLPLGAAPGSADAPDFRSELRRLINKHNMENASNTPDFILAQYLTNCLWAWNQATQQREKWYGRDARPTDPPKTVSDEEFALAKAAVLHVLGAIADDPRKFWLMGDMTGSYEKLTAAAAAIWGESQDEIKATFRPRKDNWEYYVQEHEANEDLLRYCREKGITVNYE